MIDRPLDADRIREAFAGSGRRIEFLPETVSTNDDAWRLARDGAAHGSAVFADWQSGGRGRRGAVWISPPRRNLLASVVLRPALPQEDWPRLTQACALAVCDALDELPGLRGRAGIKWPNDVFLDDRKVCGILTEGALERGGGTAIAGVGVNLNLSAAEIPEDLAGSATSAAIASGRPVDREAFAISFLRRLDDRVQQCVDDWPAASADVGRRDWLAGRAVTVISGDREIRGVAAGTGAGGELLVTGADGATQAVVSAASVHVRWSPDGARAEPGAWQRL